MTKTKFYSVIILPLIMTLLLSFSGYSQVTIQGDLKQWHKVTLEIEGPNSSETGTPNPFYDYAVHVKFTQGKATHIIPGYFAADGNAGITGAASGNKWKVHFRPPSTGTWKYQVFFKSGKAVRLENNLSAGSAVKPANGKKGKFSIAPTDKDPTQKDFRGKGRLLYVNEHYLQFQGSGQWSIKAGSDSPENFLAYDDFDNTPNLGGKFRKNWQPHIIDWQTGDPTWGDRNEKGKGIIGAVNYLSNKGLNIFSFLTMNIGGDDKNIYPYLTRENFKQMDCSKLDQWEIVFDHSETKGLQLHIKTQETECETLLDNGNLGNDRKLYYLELIARFGHHLALIWDLGEENGSGFNKKAKYQNDEQRIAMANFFRDNDPFQQNIVIHCAPKQDDKIYLPMIGNKSGLTGCAVQERYDEIHPLMKKWIAKSAAAGKKWVVANDEQNKANHGVPVDNFYEDTKDKPNKHSIRKQTLWGALMAGSAGVEYYFGYEQPENDLNCQNLRSRDKSWDYCRHALNFFNEYIPFWEMKNMDEITYTKDAWIFGKENEVYVAYLLNGGNVKIDLPSGKNYQVDWFDPRNGKLKTGNKKLAGMPKANIGTAPDETNDWVALIRAEGFVHKGNVVDKVENEDKVIIQKTVTDAGCPFIEQDGLLVIEAESALGYEEAGFKLVTDQVEKTTPTGIGYLQYIGDDNNNNKEAENNIIRYKIQINNPGTYQFLSKNIVPPHAKTTDTTNNAWLLIKGDGAYFFGIKNKKRYLLAHHTKIWVQKSDVVYKSFAESYESGYKITEMDLEVDFRKAGEYIIEYGGRSNGHSVDRIVLFKKEQISLAKDTTTAESKKSAKCNCKDITMKAADFPLEQIEGFKPAYFHKNKKALAIHAGKFKGKYAAVKKPFTGDNGIYNITFTTLTELDGESSYKLKIGNKIVGTYQNPESTADYSPTTKVWENITIKKGDMIQVEFNSHTNGKITEGTTTAYSRGRWTKLKFSCLEIINTPVTGITITPNTATISIDQAISLEASITPNDASNQTIIWTSGDPAVATVSNTGIVTGNSIGKVLITGTTVDGKFKAETTVTVGKAGD